MKKKLLLLLMILATIALLTSCACEHEWVDATCVAPKTCSLCEEIEGEPLGHTWADPDCVNPKTCTACGLTEGEALGHTWVDADCVTPKTCSVCAATEGEALGHTWVDADCVTPKTCSVCAATDGEALGHTWVDADCVTPKTCSVCAATDGEALGHTWVDADCVTPKTCSVCAATEGEALGHTWVEADCVTPKTCSVCAATEGEALGHTWVDADCVTPKTCSVCALTEGEALGHTWVDADCVTPKTCSVCAATEGEALGHTWVEATYEAPKTCTVCSATEGEPLVRALLAGEASQAGPSIGKLDFSIPADWDLESTSQYYKTPDGDVVITLSAEDNQGSDLQFYYDMIQGIENISNSRIETNEKGVEYLLATMNNQVPAVIVAVGEKYYYIQFFKETQEEYTIEEGDPLLLLADDIAAALCTSEGETPAPVTGSKTGMTLQYLPISDGLYYSIPEGSQTLQAENSYTDANGARVLIITQIAFDDPSLTNAVVLEDLQNNGNEYSALEIRTNENGVEYVYSVRPTEEYSDIFDEFVVHDNVYYQFVVAFDPSVFETTDSLYTFVEDLNNSFLIAE